MVPEKVPQRGMGQKTEGKPKPNALPYLRDKRMWYGAGGGFLLPAPSAAGPRGARLAQTRPISRSELVE